MKKVSLRASLALLMAFMMIVGLVVYVVRYIQHDEEWALFFDASTSGC